MPPHAGVHTALQVDLDRLNPGPSGKLGVVPHPPALGKGGVPSRAPTDRADPAFFAPHNTVNAAAAAGSTSTRRLSPDSIQKRRIPPGFRRHRARVLNPAGSAPVGSPPLRAARRTGRGGPLQQAMDRQVILLTWAREAQKRERNLIAAVHRSAAAAIAAPAAGAAGGELAAPAGGALASALSSPAELRALLVDWSKANLERSQQLSTWATQNYQMLQGEMLSEQRRAVSPPQTLLGGAAPAPAGPIGPIGPRYHNIQPAAQSTPMSPVHELPESPFGFEFTQKQSFKQRLLQAAAVQHEAAAAHAAHAAAAGRRSLLSSPPASAAVWIEAEHAHGRAPVSPSPAGSCSEDYLSSADETAATQGLLALRQQQQGQQGQGLEVEVEVDENVWWPQASTATSTPWMTRPRQAASAFNDNDGRPVSGGEDIATATSATVTTPATGLVFPGPAVIPTGAIPTGDAATQADNDELELERRLSRVFPDDVLKLGRAEFAAWKAARQIGPLAPAETKALAKLRRKVLSRVYANRARTRRANEREMLWIENERLRSLQSQIEVDVA